MAFLWEVNMKHLSNLLRSMGALLAGLVLLSGCDGGDGSSTGTLRLSITDQPACGYDKVFITVEQVRVHQSGDAGDADSGWHQIVLVPARRIDLLTLTNGVLEELGQTALPAGKYTQMRLVLADNRITPLANSVVPTGGSEVELTTPSGQQTGLKMNVDITVEPDKVADFVIDFDACKSVVKAGASGQFLLKPVVSVIPLLSDAGQRIVGYLDTGTLGTATQVSAQIGGIVVKATPPDATSGQFVLYPVPPGTYDLVFVSSGRATAVMTGVPVVTTAHTLVGSDSVRIALSGSATHDASGTVMLNGSPVDTAATVRALQTPHNGPTVEVSSMPVDASTGAYGFTLPTGAPQMTAYSANPVAITFAADSADPALTAAGQYTLEASPIAGLASQTAAIDLSGSSVVTNFSFTAP
jgi:hypothetical protein